MKNMVCLKYHVWLMKVFGNKFSYQVAAIILQIDVKGFKLFHHLSRRKQEGETSLWSRLQEPIRFLCSAQWR